MLPLFHTIDIYTRTGSFQNYTIQKMIKEKNMLRQEPYPIKGGYVYLLRREFGVSKIILWDKEDGKYEYHAIEIKLNPKLLLEEDNFADITYLEEMNIVYKKFSKFINEFKYVIDNNLVSDLPCLDNWKVKRIDPAIDVIVNRPDHYMELLLCGDLPKGYYIKENRDNIDETVKDKSISFYAESRKKNITFNFYHKGMQQEIKKANDKNIQKSKNKIRFEVQCEGSKIHHIVKKYYIKNNMLIHMINPKITEDIITYYYKKVFRIGDYYTFKEAKKQIMKADLSKRKKENLIQVLEWVKLYKTIRRARETYISENIGTKKKFNSCLDLFDSININPVTIPKRFGKRKMENLYKKINNQFITDKYIIHINL